MLDHEKILVNFAYKFILGRCKFNETHKFTLDEWNWSLKWLQKFYEENKEDEFKLEDGWKFGKGEADFGSIIDELIEFSKDDSDTTIQEVLPSQMKTFLLSLLRNAAPKVHKERFKEEFVHRAKDFFMKEEDGGPLYDVGVYTIDLLCRM